MKVFILVEGSDWTFNGVFATKEEATKRKDELITEVPRLLNSLEILERDI
jgi:hypothetical protein